MAEGKVLKAVVKLAGAIDPSLAKSIEKSSNTFKKYRRYRRT